MVFNGVVLHDEYRLPARFAPADIVIDVGAHIGSFAYAVVQRGGEHVCSIEPDAANCALAARHLDPYIRSGRVQLRQEAVWRSNPNDDALRFDGYHPFPRSFTGMEGIVNTGNGSVVFGAGKPVAKVSLDDLIDSLTEHGQRAVRLLKLDCEGAEWPILLTSRRLHLIDEIVGEFHEIGGPSWRSARIGRRRRPSSTPIAWPGSRSRRSCAACATRASASPGADISGPTVRSKGWDCSSPRGTGARSDGKPVERVAASRQAHRHRLQHRRHGPDARDAQRHAAPGRSARDPLSGHRLLGRHRARPGPDHLPDQPERRRRLRGVPGDPADRRDPAEP